MAQTVIALYENMDTAQKVVRELRDAGFPREDISLVAHDAAGEYTKGMQKDKQDSVKDGAAAGAGAGAVIGGLVAGLGALMIPGVGPVLAAGPLGAAIAALIGAGAGAVAGGLLGALIDMGVPDEEAQKFAEGVRRGGVLVAVETEGDRVNRARDIMNRYDPVDIDKRAGAWRTAGWQGYSHEAEPYTAEQVTRERERVRKLEESGEVRLPVAEEEMAVGKREVQRGGVRIHQRVTERPVEKDVRLREEHVDVERRKVDRPVDPEMLDTFEEGTMEVRTSGEEPVVEKRARIKEEVIVDKDVEQHTEKVRGTVRSTDVDVERLEAPEGEIRDYDRYRPAFQGHYQSNFANTGYKFEHFEPAYQYGYSLRNDKRYRDRDWKQLEPEARRTWEERNPGTWVIVADAVRYGYESPREKARR